MIMINVDDDDVENDVMEMDPQNVMKYS